MSRSRQKVPIFGYTTAQSEKDDKRKWNRSYRRVAKIFLAKDKEVPNKIESVSDVWTGGKDGKRYLTRVSKKGDEKVNGEVIKIVIPEISVAGGLASVLS